MMNLKRVVFYLIAIFVSFDSYSQTTNWENFVNQAEYLGHTAVVKETSPAWKLFGGL